MYYEENLRVEYLKKYDHFIDDASLEKAKQKLKELCNIIPDKDTEKTIGNPPKYYAILNLDGDSMGKWLSGDFLVRDESKENLRKFHEKVSEKLGEYANKVGEIIKEPKGKLIYAGGDDAMAFVNLKHLFDVLSDLRKECPKFEEFGYKVIDDIKSSASTGIVVAHYKTPFSEVLKWVKKMEKEAKENENKNAFAIAVLKHSGEINKTVWKWNVDNENKSSTIKLFEELIRELNDEKEGFSNTFIKNLCIEFQKLGKIEDVMVQTELKRLLNRSSRIEKDKEKKKQKIQKWQKKLFNLYINSQTKDNFLSFLNIADFLVREAK